MSFNIGDVVVLSTRKGAVQYTVTDIPVPNEQITIKSHNSGKETVVGFDRLTLVTAAPSLAPEKLDNEAREAIARHVEDPNHDDVDFSAMPGMVPVPADEPLAPWEVQLLHGGINPQRPYLLTVDGVTSEHKTYSAACDALILASRKGIQAYAVIDHEGQRKATRTVA